MTNAASLRQNDAATPDRSTWLRANAGSGKTRVLTDRVARLLLGGTDPQHILCLTYTKAAASEMQNRLFRKLGDWAMKPDHGLAADLEALGEAGPFDRTRLQDARRLFAQAIEAPGGLKIQTIHAFCASILRRFPLEAGVSPNFAEMEDRAAELLRLDVVDRLAEENPDLTDRFLLHVRGEDLSQLTLEIAGHRERFVRPFDPVGAANVIGADPTVTSEALVSTVWTPETRSAIDRLVPLCLSGSKSDVSLGNKLRPLLGRRQIGLDEFCILIKVLLTAKDAKSPFSSKAGSIPTKATRSRDPALCEEIDDLADRVAAMRGPALAQGTFERTAALHEYGSAFVSAYEAAKLDRGLLDFDDLIGKARDLLTDPAVAQWILFRLDGGIDHILVDEAQDTSPRQWEVIESLAREFTTGEGARIGTERTIFVVGDKKQSIYSFQGADPQGFDRMARHFGGALSAVGQSLGNLKLEHSFRSSPAILSVVDRTFSGDLRRGLEDEISHIAYHGTLPGRVDLWPIIEKAEDKSEGDWHDPVDRKSPEHHDKILAKAVADEICRLKAEETIPDLLDGPEGARLVRRPITEGDILVLVQRRGGPFEEIIMACKAAGLDVAGADRMKIGAELAVRDLAALLRFLALPEDSLSLATALRSPLFGWSEQDLFTLAHNRGKQHLWQALRGREEYAETLGILDDLLRQSDFLRPYDLIQRILIRHGGRLSLLARLGQEAEDGIDALLSQALAFERSSIPDLTGFLSWMETDDVDVKRQADSQGSRLRVMTVHGAKGLEAPIVILPDTMGRRTEVRNGLLPAGNTAIWRPAADLFPPTLQPLRDDIVTAQAEERRRLLYVAMTRAEKWLIVCGAGQHQGKEGWHPIVKDGLEAAGAAPLDTPTGPGLRFSFGDWEGPPSADTATRSPVPAIRPDFGPVRPPDRDTVLSPSDLGGAKTLPGEPADPPGEDPLLRGTAIHRLLEHLPPADPSQRRAVGRQLLAMAPEFNVLSGREELIDQAIRVLDAGHLAQLFSGTSLAEVGVSAQLPSGTFYGEIDRLVVEQDRILAVDFKTNRVVPDTVEDVPEGLLRQLGAYAAMLARVYPDRPVETAILWTETATLMPLPAPLVSAALDRATAP